MLGIIVALAIVLLGGGGSGFEIPAGFDTGQQAPSGEPIPPGEDPDAELKDFSTYVFNDAQDSWARTFEASGRPYERAKVVFYSGAVDTACGSASSAVGPFYCPGDRRVYLDLSFFDDMERKLDAPGQ